MKRRGFTLIEAIFVIVLIGILAAVAIPKFAAMRDDAEISRKAYNIMTTAFEIASYAVAKGSVETDLAVMSPLAGQMRDSGEAALSPDRADYTQGSAAPCIRLAIERNAEGVDLNISMPNSGADVLCDQLQSAIGQGTFPIKLRGRSVDYD